MRPIQEKSTHNPLLSCSRICFSARRAWTLGSLHSSFITGAHRFSVCTGSSGSSHQPISSPPESALFGLWILPSAKCFFQFRPVRIASSCVLLTMLVVGDVGDRGDVRPALCADGYDADAGGIMIRGGRWGEDDDDGEEKDAAA